MERGPTFSCPSCRTTLSASDSRTALIRWGSVFLLMGIAAIGFRAFEVTRGETESTLWFAYALAFPIFCGLQLTLPILFPPKLQCGDPQFIALNLTETVRKKDTDDAGMGKSQKSDDSPA